eukprot:s1879_g15.t1
MIEDGLIMAYREPRSLLGNLPLGQHPVCRDPPAEVARLAKLWDQSGLLRLYSCPRPVGSLVKVFNCYKNQEQDRQIGDRRGQNSYEGRVLGPSRDLPSGPDMMDLYVDIRKSKAVLVITDRKDYYHQIWVTDARSSTNAVGPSLHKSLVEDTTAYSAYLLREAMAKRSGREKRGDDLHSFSGHPGEAEDFEFLGKDHVWACFGSILQGDHAGVEVATSAHEQWLREFGLLKDESRLTASRCLRSDRQLQGLVIDDYFAVSVEPISSDNKDSAAFKCYTASQEAYKTADLLGSPSKDVVGENEGRIIGAYINSSSRATSRGLCTVGAPAMKRIALSFITLALCSLPFTTDVLHLCLLGGWVSILSFRRPLMSILNKCYHMVDQNTINQNNPKLVKLSRSAANELVLLAVLVPLAISDMSAEYFDRVFSTDASSTKGAICSAEISPLVAQVLWKSCRSKGSYTRLLSPAEQILRRNGLFEEEKLDQPTGGGPERPLAYEYGFIEIFSGASLVSKAIAAYGVVVGPPLDIGISEEYNLAYTHVMRWLTFLLSSKRLKAFLVSPPCTTFSIMRRPRLRSAEQPFGFDPQEEKTRTGNILGQRGAQLLYTAGTNDAAGIMETTYSSYLKHLPGWKAVRGLECAEEVRTDSCAFGSIHLKPFRFLGVNVRMASLARRCSCSTPHVKVEGSYTKASATYVSALVEELAACLYAAIVDVRERRFTELSVEVSGLENQLVNEVARVHGRLVTALSKERRPLRVVNLVDSYVVRGATSKGRSSSRGLSSILRRVCATCIASALYMTIPFVPTRWNPSDDPTRDVPLRASCTGLNLETWTEAELYGLSELPKTKKWASLWMRMVLRMLGASCLCLADRSLFRQSSIAQQYHNGPRHIQKNFDSTLGYPGEGPRSRVDRFHVFLPFISKPLPFWIFALSLASLLDFLFHLISISSTWTAAVGLGLLCHAVLAPRWLWISVICSCLLPGAHAMPLFPRTAGERSKAASRLLRPPVPQGRPVLPITQQRRGKLLEQFFIWASDEGLDLLAMLDNHQIFIDDINIVLERYGRKMYDCGMSYGKYAETINALTSWKPALRRMLAGAWDFGYAWNKHEPGVHHTAMPGPVMLAVLTTSMIWGWTQFAGVVALMWAGLLRPGEVLSATRSDLLLPIDGDATIPFGLLSIRDPKTRLTHARHQSAKIDAPDLLRVITLFLGPLKQHQQLWPMSGNTLRSRLYSVLQALKLPATVYNNCRPLELASIRAGSATWLMSTLENPEFLQRRGRWANKKMMDIYVQEITAVTYLQRIPSEAKATILTVADSFVRVLAKAEIFVQANIPTNAWPVLFQAQSQPPDSSGPVATGSTNSESLICVAYFNMGAEYEHLKKASEALWHYQRAYDSCLQELGEEHPLSKQIQACVDQLQQRAKQKAKPA